MGDHDTDVEVGGSIEIAYSDKATYGSSKDSTAKEGCFKGIKRRILAVDQKVLDRAFKTTFFFICLILTIMWFVRFFDAYYKYPTDIVTKIIIAEEFKLPAITLCFRNTISFHEFCLHEPDLCEEPRNKKEFCDKPGSICWPFPNLTIPKDEVQESWNRKIIQYYLVNDSYNDADLFNYYRLESTKRTFILDFVKDHQYMKCYSNNLHLYQSGSELETSKFDFSQQEGKEIFTLLLNQKYVEPFPWKDEPQIFFAIHSPYVPVDPLELKAVERGKLYDIVVQLEKEEHLLPPPYQTNCQDNSPTKDGKETTNPNSYQVCLDLCRAEFNRVLYGCGFGMTMTSIEDLCYMKKKQPSRKQYSEQEDKRFNCFQNCKQGCQKLQYKYSIMEQPIYRYDSLIEIYVKNPEVTVLKHVPFYSSDEICRLIGGVLVCWFFITLFSFTDILENFVHKVFCGERESKG